MEEQLKARLIGATVLVVVAVALVPELLSGRKHVTAETAAEGARGTRTYTIDLSGGTAAPRPAEPTPAPAQTVAQRRELPESMAAEPAPSGAASADATSDEVPAMTGPATAAPVIVPGEPTQKQPTASTPAATSAPLVKASAAPNAVEPKPATTAPGGFSVQVGAFGSAETARKLVGDLRRDGFTAYVSPLSRSGKTLHRVRVGPTPNRPDADKLAARLKARGLPATVVTGG